MFGGWNRTLVFMVLVGHGGSLAADCPHDIPAAAPHPSLIELEVCILPEGTRPLLFPDEANVDEWCSEAGSGMMIRVALYGNALKDLLAEVVRSSGIAQKDRREVVARIQYRYGRVYTGDARPLYVMKDGQIRQGDCVLNPRDREWFTQFRRLMCRIIAP